MEPSAKPANRFDRIVHRMTSLWNYVSTGVWSDPRRNWKINILRTLNLSVRSFMSRDIQTQACAMTYRTLLAIVPALALLLAIGRGFGFQSVLKDELFALFPAQHTAIRYAVNFVESYLSQASEGIFVGAGILFLLWTLISLISNVENTFNLIWCQPESRSMWRKISDYTAMLLILPILMICVSGLHILLSSTLAEIFNFSFMTPVVSAIVEGASVLMTWLFFTAVYILIPYTRVRFINAFISGAIAGTGCLVLQWLFVTGTLYVAKYNAIYGSFAFVPLLLLWLQLVWMVVLAGAVICYSGQNVFAFNLDQEVSNISPDYRGKAMIAIAAVMTRRFVDGHPAVTARELMDLYDLPARLVTNVTDRLCAAGILSRVMIGQKKDEYGFQLAVDPSKFTLAQLFRANYGLGSHNFIPDFTRNFPLVEKTYGQLTARMSQLTGSILMSSLLTEPVPGNEHEKPTEQPKTI
ncbi:MAG: YihY/virulence factor BrkB family protein [Muribaculaceae bacterium]|nr:YihY/virulence factor BrkB family protein [Muribaculaceae bacterium]